LLQLRTGYSVETATLRGIGAILKRPHAAAKNLKFEIARATICATSLILLSGLFFDAALSMPFGKSKNSKDNPVTIKYETKGNNREFITARTLIEAPPRIVWDAVHEERQKDPDIEYSKVLETSENKCRLEQKFKLIPVFGTAVCEMHNWEVPLERIDYKLIKSDRFKSMEGSWVLTSKEDGRFTMLELSTHLDLGIPVPGGLMKSVTSKKLTKRLSNVKKVAEQTQKQMATKTARVPAASVEK